MYTVPHITYYLFIDVRDQYFKINFRSYFSNKMLRYPVFSSNCLLHMLTASPHLGRLMARMSNVHWRTG